MTGLTVLATACAVAPAAAREVAPRQIVPADVDGAIAPARSAKLLELLQVLETLRQVPVELAPQKGQ